MQQNAGEKIGKLNNFGNEVADTKAEIAKLEADIAGLTKRTGLNLDALGRNLEPEEDKQIRAGLSQTEKRILKLREKIRELNKKIDN